MWPQILYIVNFLTTLILKVYRFNKSSKGIIEDGKRFETRPVLQLSTSAWSSKYLTIIIFTCNDLMQVYFPLYSFVLLTPFTLLRRFNKSQYFLRYITDTLLFETLVLDDITKITNG